MKRKHICILLLIALIFSMLPADKNIYAVTSIATPDNAGTVLGQLPVGWVREDYNGNTYTTGSDANYNYFTVVDGSPYGYPTGTRVLQANTRDRLRSTASRYSRYNINKITAGEYSYKDYTLSGSFSIQEKTANIILRHNPKGQFYIVSFNIATNKVYLYKVDHAARSELKSAALISNVTGRALWTKVNTVYNYKVDISTGADGSANIKVYFANAGNLVLDYTDIKPITAGKFGYWLNYYDKACYNGLAVSLVSNTDYSLITIKNGDITLRYGEKVQLAVEGSVNGKIEDITPMVRYEVDNANVTVTPTGLLSVSSAVTSFPVTSKVTAVYDNIADATKTRKAIISVTIAKATQYSNVFDFNAMSSIQSAFENKNYDTKANYLSEFTTDNNQRVFKIATNSKHKMETIYYTGNNSHSGKYVGNQSLKATLKFEAGDAACLVLNYDPQTDNAYKLFISQNGIGISKVVKKASIDFQVIKYRLKPNTYYALTVKIKQSPNIGMSLYIDDLYIGSYNDTKANSPLLNSGYVGFSTTNAPNNTFFLKSILAVQE